MEIRDDESTEHPSCRAHSGTRVTESYDVLLCRAHSKLDGVGPLYRRALEGFERQARAPEADTLVAEGNLALLRRARDDLSETERLCRLAREDGEQQFDARPAETSGPAVVQSMQAQATRDNAGTASLREGSHELDACSEATDMNGCSSQGLTGAGTERGKRDGEEEKEPDEQKTDEGVHVGVQTPDNLMHAKPRGKEAGAAGALFDTPAAASERRATKSGDGVPPSPPQPLLPSFDTPPTAGHGHARGFRAAAPASAGAALAAAKTRRAEAPGLSSAWTASPHLLAGAHHVAEQGGSGYEGEGLRQLANSRGGPASPAAARGGAPSSTCVVEEPRAAAHAASAEHAGHSQAGWGFRYPGNSYEEPPPLGFSHSLLQRSPGRHALSPGAGAFAWKARAAASAPSFGVRASHDDLRQALGAARLARAGLPRWPSREGGGTGHGWQQQRRHEQHERARGWQQQPWPAEEQNAMASIAAAAATAAITAAAAACSAHSALALRELIQPMQQPAAYTHEYQYARRHVPAAWHGATHGCEVGSGYEARLSHGHGGGACSCSCRQGGGYYAG